MKVMHKRHRYYLCLTLCLLSGSIASPSGLAQILPDASLPNNSIVNLEAEVQRITGGTEAGGNLFHSFEQFNLRTGETAHFDNALTTLNIITRVTGGQISNIDGLIQANGTANLFLLNPNGIVFGENARLDIGGSFFGSTAESLVFEDGSFYSATEANAPPLLTLNVPIGLQFGENPGSIVHRSIASSPSNVPNPILSLLLPPTLNLAQVGLEVPPGETLALVGGEIQLAGGNLTAPNGQIFLGSIAEPGLVSFAPTPLDWHFDRDGIENFGKISLSDGSVINTNGAGGGRVEIVGGDVTLSSSQILALTLDNLNGRGIALDAQTLRMGEGAQLSTLTLGTGAGGGISLAVTDSVELRGLDIESFNQSIERFLSSRMANIVETRVAILSGTIATGDAGEIAIDTPKLLLTDGVSIRNATSGAGNSGNVMLRVGVLELESSNIFSGTIAGSGRSGNITFEGERVSIRDGAFLASTTVTPGRAGDITLHATESVELLRTPKGSIIPTSIITTTTDPRSRAGDVTINTGRLTLADGTLISTSSSGRVGSVPISQTGGLGGNIEINATESIDIFGFSEVLANGGVNESVISARTFSSSPGGDIDIATPRLTLRDGGAIAASSSGAGKAGDITIHADRVDMNGGAIRATTGMERDLSNPDATASAGSIELNVDRLRIEDGASISVQSTGSADAGRLQVMGNAIALDNKSFIDASTGSGEGGNITLQTQDLQLHRGSGIETDAGAADGGNITIDTQTLTALENSDISANSTDARGGNITINAQGIFGTAFRLSPTAESDITATGRTQQDLGTVELNTPDLDTTAGLLKFSPETIDIATLISQNPCRNRPDSSFTITGRAALLEDPRQFLPGRVLWEDWSLPASSSPGERGATRTRRRRETRDDFPSFPSSLSSDGREEEHPPRSLPPPPLVEARGWVQHPNGTIELVAQVPLATSGSFGERSIRCGNF